MGITVGASTDSPRDAAPHGLLIVRHKSRAACASTGMTSAPWLPKGADLIPVDTNLADTNLADTGEAYWTALIRKPAGVFTNTMTRAAAARAAVLPTTAPSALSNE